MFRRLLDRLDAFGTDDPDFAEGQPEDRCPVCDRAVDEHVGRAPAGLERARWPHRRAAAIALLLD